MKKAMTPEYKKDADGNFILDEDGNRMKVSRGGYGTANGQTVEFYSLSQKQADELWTALTSATAVNDYSENSIFDIVSEQSQAFFAGQKSAEDVVARAEQGEYLRQRAALSCRVQKRIWARSSDAPPNFKQKLSFAAHRAY